MDNKQNGLETGIDCGGLCADACVADVGNVSILWSRAFRVVPGRYNAVAYLQNHNKNVAVEKINYRFRFADANNIYIGKRDGSTFIPPAGKFAVFEPAIDVGNSIPVFTTFQFIEEPRWQQVREEKIDQLKVTVADIRLEDEEVHPTLSATIKNNSLFTIPEVSVIALMYDAAGNAVSTSRTYLDVLNPEEMKNINFTWPEPVTAHVVSEEIIPIFNIFRAVLK